MKQIIRNGLTILEPANNMYIANKEKNEVYDREIYLGKSDSADNYVEISSDERLEILNKIEEERLELEARNHISKMH